MIVLNIIKYVWLQINRENNYPNKICLSCVDDLIISYQFKNKCDASNIKLKQYLEFSKQMQLEHTLSFKNISNDKETIDLDQEIIKEPKQIGVVSANVEENAVLIENISEEIFRENNEELQPNDKTIGYKSEKYKRKIKDANSEIVVNEKKVCQICRKMFVHTSSLKMHMKRHNGNTA